MFHWMVIIRNVPVYLLYVMYVTICLQADVKTNVRVYSFQYMVFIIFNLVSTRLMFYERRLAIGLCVFMKLC